MSDQRLPAVHSASQLDFISHSPAQTERVGQRLGEQLRPGDLILLMGTFGVGKTHLVKGIARGLGATDLVTSPSFVLVNEYRAGAEHGAMPIYHVDLYRLAGAADLATLGLEELWEGRGVCLIEWPEQAEAMLPDDHLVIQIEHLSETKRHVRFVPHGTRYLSLISSLRGGS
jgi:tRNA threonylcarbamoyladenosine biosynthesis protein TsaE